MAAQTFDTTTRPQDDYFGYVNNTWLAANRIPASESSWGTFYVLRDQSWTALQAIIDELTAADPHTLSHDQQLLKTFFTAAMSYDSHADANVTVLRSELEAISALHTADDLPAYLGWAHRRNLNHFWEVFVDMDDKDSRVQVLRFAQGGLRLPNRDYYLDTSQRMQDIRTAYADHFAKVRAVLPQDAPATWQPIIDLETRLAEHSWTDVELRDAEKNYHHYTVAELKATFGAFDWDAYFAALSWQNPSDHLVVGQPSFFTAAIDAMAALPFDDVRAYLAWQVISGALTRLNESCSEVFFDFYGKTLSGTTEQKPLWKRSILQADQLIIGEALGREYAARHFPESSKQAVANMVEDIRAAYHTRISNLTWMSDSSKTTAHTKLDNIKVFVGYPSVWQDLSALAFDETSHFANVMKARELDTDKELAKVGQPPAAEDWGMNAHTVNAYNHPNRLEIVFPAAILQPPFFDPTASYATNLGGIGSVIGHELTHSFDDEGSRFDEHGNIKPWLSPEEQASFKALAQHIVDQANAYEVLPGTHLQGELILGEAIADVGGVELAVEALKARATDDTELAQGLQDIFIGLAHVERGKVTDERAIELAKTDPHPPSRFRVNCVLAHVDDFYSAYNVTPHDALYAAPDKRAHIW